MKATTIFKFIGILFVVIGAVVGIGMLAGGFGSTERPMIFMGVMFLVMFCGIGGLFAVIGFRMDREDKKVLEQGSSYLGKILDYRPDMRVTINGAPALALVIRYYRMGEICLRYAHRARGRSAESGLQSQCQCLLGRDQVPQLRRKYYGPLRYEQDLPLLRLQDHSGQKRKTCYRLVKNDSFLTSLVKQKVKQEAC